MRDGWRCTCPWNDSSRPYAIFTGRAGAQREQARVDLHVDVLARAERPADPGQRDPHLLLGQPEAGRDLLPVDVQPLRAT